MRILKLLILLLLLLGGYVYYRTYYASAPVRLSTPPSRRINISQSQGTIGNLKNVLGESISRVWETGTGLLNDASGGTAEPIINKAVEDLQTRVKELPQEQYDRVKYEFCKDIIVN